MRKIFVIAFLTAAVAACAPRSNEAASSKLETGRDPHGTNANADATYAGGSEGVEPATAICGEVRIAPELAAKVTPDAILFVFSKAQLGGGAPAAVVRRETPAFPTTFCLSQKNSMAGASFSGAQYVTARVEFDTSAGGQAGDLETVTKDPVTVGTSNLILTIDTVRP